MLLPTLLFRNNELKLKCFHQKSIIGEGAKRVRHPVYCYLSKKMFGRKYVKATMRMLTILPEAEEWTHGHLREVCLLFASAITKSSLYVR